MDIMEIAPNSSHCSSIKAYGTIEYSVPDGNIDTESSDEYSNCKDECWSDADTLLATSVGSLSDIDAIPSGIMHKSTVDEDIKPEQILSSLCITGPATAILSIPQPSPNTCLWILKHPKYIEWQTTRSSVLWIEGPSGYGKSVLVNFLVNETYTTPPCYFICESNTKDRNNRRAVLRNILYQLMLRHPELISHAKTAYYNLGRNFSESLNALVKIFKNCSQDPKLGDLIIIIDGLDECSDFRELASLDWITSTLQLVTTNALRFIVTSRPSSAFPRVPSSSVIRLLLDTEARTEIGHDVHRFIDTTVNELSSAQKWTSGDQIEFVKELEERSKKHISLGELVFKAATK